MTFTYRVFVIVVVMDLTPEMEAMSVINQPIGVAIKLSAIIKICKYRGIHEPFYFDGHGGAKRTQA
jgi:hypothetical protein